jgi:hypothetical protein
MLTARLFEDEHRNHCFYAHTSGSADGATADNLSAYMASSANKATLIDLQ